MIALSTPEARQHAAKRLPRSNGIADEGRWLDLALGGGLIVAGILRGSWGGLALAACGALLFWRGDVGAQAPRLPEAARAMNDEDNVVEASEESFPASDPPGWNSSSIGRARETP